MNRAVLVGAAVALVVAGFGGYVAWQLGVHGATCDSAYRHCAVPREEIAFLEGDWCLATDPLALRERVVFEPERILVRQEGPLAGPDRPWVEARIFRSMGELVYFEHDPRSGARLSSELSIARTGENARQTTFGRERIGWVRC